jgi:hypothetical protein
MHFVILSTSARPTPALLMMPVIPGTSVAFLGALRYVNAKAEQGGPETMLHDELLNCKDLVAPRSMLFFNSALLVIDSQNLKSRLRMKP